TYADTCPAPLHHCRSFWWRRREDGSHCLASAGGPAGRRSGSRCPSASCAWRHRRVRWPTAPGGDLHGVRYATRVQYEKRSLSGFLPSGLAKRRGILYRAHHTCVFRRSDGPASRPRQPNEQGRNMVKVIASSLRKGNVVEQDGNLHVILT